MFDCGVETPHFSTKESWNELLVRYSLKHWKQPKSSIKQNLWWIIFFSIWSINWTHWKSLTSPRQRQWWYLSSKRIVHVDWVPEGQTGLTRSTIRIGLRLWQNFINEWEEKDLKFRRMASRFFIAGIQLRNSLSIKTFLTRHKITVLEHTPYLPDPALCDLFTSKERIYIKSIQVSVSRCSTTKNNGQRTTCNIASNSARLERWRNRGGEYIEGDNISTSVGFFMWFGYLKVRQG